MAKFRYFFFLIYITFTITMPVFAAAPTPSPCPTGVNSDACVSASLPFTVPNLGDLITFGIRGFFVLAGLLALLYLLLGALAWITSGGNKESVDKARDKITAALLGIIIIVGVLAIIVTLEQIVFQKHICFGITCPASIPSLIQP